MRYFLRRLRSDSRGVTALEYALIAAFIFLVIVVSVTTVGKGLSPIFSTVGSEL
jgi:pilus assembly protein Flp/PilA